jgi:hypothetical protein
LLLLNQQDENTHRQYVTAVLFVPSWFVLLTKAQWSTITRHILWLQTVVAPTQEKNCVNYRSHWYCSAIASADIEPAPSSKVVPSEIVQSVKKGRLQRRQRFRLLEIHCR